MKDVARRAGVSVATVSHVINGTRFVNPETKNKVLKAVEGLNYVPNAAAKSLKSKSSKTIKIVLPKEGYSYQKEMHFTLIDEMLPFWNEKKYSISLHQIDYENEEEYNQVFLHSMDGMIIFSPTNEMYHALSQKNVQIPCVFLDFLPEDEEDGNFIYIDHFHTMYHEVEKLLKKEHHRIGYLENTEGSKMNQGCKKAYNDAFLQNDVQIIPDLMKSIPSSSEGGYEIAKQWLSNKSVDAIICNDEQISLGMTRYLLEGQFEIPTIFYTNGVWGSLYEHGETIQIPCEKIALQTAEMMFQLVSKDNEEITTYQFRTEVVKAEGSIYSVEEANKFIAEHSVSPVTRWRQNYHITPLVGWLNDPNGLVQFKDEYHVFYQYHPYGPEWGPMHWGHVKSKDLVHWEHLPIALAPDQADEKGCFSGSAVEYENELRLYYTAHNDNNKMKEVQCVAKSQDGIYFKKNENNPIIKNISGEAAEDFRDPKVWKHQDKWYMIIGTSKNQDGRAVLYQSQDGENWDFYSVVATGDGELGEIWECPDLFPIGDSHILMISPINMKNGENFFLVGDFDYHSGEFKKNYLQVIDHGRDFYAGQTFLDKKGRRILVGWMHKWGESVPTQKDGWAGTLSIPREIKMIDGTIRITPVEELQRLRGDKMETNVGSIQSTLLPVDMKGNALEIECEFEIIDQVPDVFGLHVRKSKKGDEYSAILYDVQKQELIMDLSNSGKNGKEKSRVKLPLIDGKILRLRIFIDKSSIELFANDGIINMTNRIYPKDSSILVDVFAENGKISINHMTAWKMKNIW